MRIRDMNGDELLVGLVLTTMVLFLTAGALLMAAVSGEHTVDEERPARLEIARAQVYEVASSAAQQWLASLRSGQPERFGFASAAELELAEIGCPIPLIMPRRGPDLTRERVERELNELPSSWLVPVIVDGRIASLVVVSATAEGQLEAVEFGKPYRANRLSEGIAELGWPESDLWRRIRLLAFYSPAVDVLVYQSAPERWRWFNLSGIHEGQSSELGPEQVARLMESLREEPEGFADPLS